MTNYEWLQQASKDEIATELRQIANWDRQDKAKAEKLRQLCKKGDFYRYWLDLPRGVNTIEGIPYD